MSAEEEIARSLISALSNATDASTDVPDELEVDMFCSLIQQHPVLIKKSTDLLLDKIKSNNINQSRKALDVLDECMSKAGPTFQIEIAKFRFLNELIRLVSKKYLADKTPVEIREKIMDLLLLWTVQYPDKTKIKEAYDILRKEGVEHAVTPSVCPSGKRKVHFEPNDEEMLKKFLHSKNPEDFLKANLLIKRLYRQDEKKNDLYVRQKRELSEAKNTVAVLDEVINSWVQDHEGNESQENGLMKDLYEDCKRFVKTIVRISQTVEDDEELLKEAIEVSDCLTEVIEKYKNIVVLNKKPKNTKIESNVPAASACLDLLSATSKPNSSDISSHSLEQELRDVFKPNLKSFPSPFECNADLLPNAGILKPVLIDNSNLKFSLTETGKSINENNNSCNSPINSLSDIDRISNELLKQSLDSTKQIPKFNKETPKIPLNQLIKGSQTDKNDKAPENILLANGIVPVLNISPNFTNKETILDFTAKEQNNYSIDQILSKVESISNMRKDQKRAESEKEELEKSAKIDKETVVEADVTPKIDFSDLLLSGDEKLLDINNSPNKVSEASAQPGTPKKDMPLSEISLEITDIKPSRISPMIIKDDPEGLRIVLNFAQDHPSPNIIVIVITTTNQSCSSVDDYEIEACVPKPSKVKLLPMSKNSLPGVEPFQPPVQNIKQILLLHNTTGKPVDITFIIGYKMPDDPDPIKEPVVAKDIPYFE